MASSATTSLVSMTLCVLLLAMAATSVSSVPDRSHYCFGYRVPIGRRGKCRDRIQPLANVTVWDAQECCRLGGSGWSEKPNGKRCVAACREPTNPPPTVGGVDPSTESLEPMPVTAVPILGSTVPILGSTEPTARSTEPILGSTEPILGSTEPILHGSTEPILGSTEPILGSTEPTAGSTEDIDEQEFSNDNLTWSEWGAWSNCTAVCGAGNITRRRTCLPVNACNETTEETIQCDANVTCLAPPPVHGQWTGWGDWSECDQLDPCHSFQTSTRSCADPPPLNGGRPCRGSSSRTRPCRRQPDCAGSWQHWGAWTACSTTECGQTGITTRTRVCDGADCPGLFLEWDGCEGAC